jgi:hypothetical protein
MLKLLFFAALLGSIVNWLFFATLVVRANRRARTSGEPIDKRSIDVSKIEDSIGSLATNFAKAGPAATAAALSVICLLIAALAAGIDKIPTH